jgi:hypothetical protein
VFEDDADDVASVVEEFFPVIDAGALGVAGATGGGTGTGIAVAGTTAGQVAAPVPAPLPPGRPGLREKLNANRRNGNDQAGAAP